MNRIIFPLKSKMKGEAVGDLQDGLQTLSDSGILELRDDRKKISEACAFERSTETFSSITVRLVKTFQEWRMLDITDEVEEKPPW